MLSFNYLNACPADRKFKLNKPWDIQGFKANSHVLLKAIVSINLIQGYNDVTYKNVNSSVADVTRECDESGITTNCFHWIRCSYFIAR